MHLSPPRPMSGGARILSPALLTALPCIDGGGHGDDSLSQPHLSMHSYSDPEKDDDDGSSSSGELLRGGGTASSGGRSSSSSSSLPRCSYGDVVLPATADGAPLPHSNKPKWHGNVRRATTDEHAVEAYFYVSAVPGYVSFEDVIGAAALYRDGSGRPLDATINDPPLMRMTSRLYARKDERSHRRRQQSPGPLGTRRGSAMHGIVKKYVHPLQGFLAGIFCCIIPS